uniref:Uncharacterized protein n=1 Tax=Callorhinchus milii TaxID=7868 RepID=A0A4W3J4A7_CALMI
MPGLTVSTDLLEFGSVLCGQCCIITLQLFNHMEVPCEWAITDTSIVKPKIDKFLPLHLRQKLRKEMKPLVPVFVVLPPCGVLMPGLKVNVQILFSPQE